MKLEVELEKKIETGAIHLSFTVENEVLGILGRSGCGKSVTLRCIAGILRPDAGRIVLDGKVLYDSREKIWVRTRERKIGYLFQDYALFPNLTVMENILFPLKRGDRKGRAFGMELIERFYLKEAAHLYPYCLSGGQKQRTAMARMLAARPEVLLLDEPFSALDSFLRGEMEREVHEVLKNFGGVSILVSHNQEEIRRLSQKCMVMNQGRMAEMEETRTLFAGPKSREGQLLIQGIQQEQRRREWI